MRTMGGCKKAAEDCRAPKPGGWRGRLTVTLFVLGFVCGSCSRKSEPAQVKAEHRSTNTQIFQVKGVIKDLKADGKTVEIRHEAVTNYVPTVSIYMPAMTMPFEVKRTNELAGLKPGDTVTFRLSVTDDDSWID